MRVLLLTIVAGLFATATMPCHGREVRIASPDGSLGVIVSDKGGIHYRVEIDGTVVLTRSRLGLAMEGNVALGRRALIENQTFSQYDGSWRNHFGKRKHVRDRWNQMRLELRESAQSLVQLVLIVRAYDDGVAFRYEVDSGAGAQDFVVVQDLTEFSFAEDYRCWAGMFLCGSGEAKVAVTLAPRDDGAGCVVSRTPRMSPWRVLMIGRRPGELLDSDLIASLSTPCKIQDTSWIKPGVCAWDAWWTGINSYLPQYKDVYSRGNTRSHKEYIDLAADMGWSYQLVDWFWYRNMSSYSVRLNHAAPDPNKPAVDFEKSEPHIDLPELLEYAERRGVKLIIWLHSDDLNTYGIDKAFRLIASWGVAGVKIDFLNSDSQETVVWCQKVLAAAARHRLLVDFHGVFKPTGLARTWPNYITQEGVLGNEYNKLDDRCTPQHTITLPFTRGLLGPMDFTPGGFLNRATGQWKMTAPAEVMGTRARQLAMTVIYESPLLVLCDSPKNYRGQPGLEFLRDLPTVWDETAVLSARVGERVALARQSGSDWWIAAMNGSKAATLEVPLDFLEPGNWRLESFADGDLTGRAAEAINESTRRVSDREILRIDLAPAGGFAGRLRRDQQ